MWRLGVLVLGAAALAAGGAQDRPDLPPPRNESTNYTPRWSPDGQRLVFARRDQGRWAIHTIDAETAELRRLTPPGADYNDREAAWSPDGRRLVFDSDRDGNREIYVMDATGGGARRLTVETAVDAMPSWSPDGCCLVFVSHRGGAAEVWTMRADGGQPTALTQGSPPGNLMLRPAWSPDGRWIAFASSRESSDGNGRRRLFLVRPDGSGLRAIGEPSFDGNHAWAPDSQRLVFDGSPENEDDTSRGQWELFVIDIATGVRRQLTHNRVNDWGPSWSPDGRSIAFSSGLNNQYEIYVIGVDGRDARRLTRLVYP